MLDTILTRVDNTQQWYVFYNMRERQYTSYSCNSLTLSNRVLLSAEWMNWTNLQWKKCSEGRKHCALAVVRRSQKNFAPPQTPFAGAQDGQNLISWRWSLPLSTNPVWWGSMHVISSYRGNRATYTHTNTNTHAHTHTDRTDYNTLRRS